MKFKENQAGGKVGKQTYLQRSEASRYIVPKYSHFSNMRPQCGAVCPLPCRIVAVYTKKVPRYHRETKNIPSNVREQMQSGSDN